ncbi:hypothetical protein LTR84_000351 [Exophiala bonariae]|uniref:RING-type domain-containing protein n=1 Tax=Exophiala bonariae TaxID=1690606 RepID=A0AAV9NUC3_9EURO|nr:hypothetical protein LTR84_000351 [Exophiala bonariae]
MDYHLSPGGSSPPIYDDYSPTSQNRSEREPTTPDQKFKRRRLDFSDSSNHSFTEATRATNAPVPTVSPRQYSTTSYMANPNHFGHYVVSPTPPIQYWDEEAALEYLSSGNGFVQDMRLAVGPPPPIRYQVQHGPTATGQPLYQAPSSLPNGGPPRPVPNITPITSGLRPLALGTFQQMPDPAFHTPPYHVHVRPGPDAGSYTYDAREMSRLVNLTANLRPPPLPYLSNEAPKPKAIPNANQIKLILSRATQDSIDALVEHKRECPACQLDFEPDNFMAIISCCDTAMHATCLSAWVNSQTYAKSKTCMKCRRAIDARRPLNSVVPPVSDQNWDDGADLNAPEAVKGDHKIEVIVSARPDRVRRHVRNTIPSHAYSSHGYTSSRPSFTSVHLPENLPAETKRLIAQVQQDSAAEFESMRRRLRMIMSQSNRASAEEDLSRRHLAEARQSAPGNPADNLDALVRKCSELRATKEKCVQETRALQKTLENLPRFHERRVMALVETAMGNLPRDTAASIRTAPHEVDESGSISTSSSQSSSSE